MLRRITINDLSLAQIDALEMIQMVGHATESSIHCRTLKALAQLGLVIKGRDGFYRLTDAGHAVLRPEVDAQA